MILWTIFAATCFVNLVALLMAGANEQYVAQVNHIQKQKWRANVFGSLLLALVSYSIPFLWTWYAFDVGDWRFAALAWIPKVASWVLKLVVPKYGMAEPASVTYRVKSR
jgi:hypothetical protein